ncbi:MAG: precorrin-3B C(17)-methyltransferase [Rhizobiales bacterium]|nr:precorrin-3B C(17)-methyltransferase [Hyphomicrobiales bacterium]NRB13594.1 precorrin-3B C(17)-methyltransferase [Hyphomicrobiales bacterium]
MPAIAYIALSPNGLNIAAKLQKHFGGEIMTKSDGNIKQIIGRLFAQKTAIIGICSAGILIRSVAGELGDKTDEPPVIAIDELGQNIVALLGGHSQISALGSAVEITQKCAQILGANAIITTAGDVSFGIALDNPPAGYILVNKSDYKKFMSNLLQQQTVSYSPDFDWLAKSKLPHAAAAQLQITVSNQMIEGSEQQLIYCPQNIVVGIGCARGAKASEIIELIDKQLGAHKLNPQAIAYIASIDVKSDEAGIHEAAKHYNVKAVFYSAEDLEAQAARLVNPSDYVFNEVGCHGVAEGAALAATGADSQLICPKVKSANATCALAQTTKPITTSKGKPQGQLYIVGMGPGQDSWRVPEATAMLEAAQDWVGYGLYIDLLGDMGVGKTQHEFALGEEEKRVRHALELAGQGKQVALICSGDAGIYAMAALVYELLDLASNKGGVTDAAKRVEVQMAPGISALQGAAARVGAPLGHDFCTISLSDLLTPWEAIKTRIHAAAEADFVISFYNPVSKKRRTQLAYAKQVLLNHRPADCPVILASNIGRAHENIRYVNLADLNIDDVDMLTLVMVGSSNSRKFMRGNGHEYVYTPRGYAKKRRLNIIEKD